MRRFFDRTIVLWLNRTTVGGALALLGASVLANAATTTQAATLTVPAVTAATTAALPLNVNVLAGASDPGYTFHVQSVNTSATKGYAVLLSDGRIGYNPYHQFDSLTTLQTGLDTVGFTVVDSAGNTKTSTLTMTVTGTIVPTSTLTVPAVTATTTAALPLNVNVLAGASDPGYAFHVQSINTSATKGYAVLLSDGRIGYNPFHQFDSLNTLQVGLDTVGFTVVDSTGSTKTSTLTMTVTGVVPPHLPVASPVAATTTAVSVVDIDVLSHATEPGAVLSLQSVNTNGTLGSVSILADQRVSYNPNHAFDLLTVNQTGTDSFTYTVTDGAGGVATGVVTVTVTGVMPVNNLIATPVTISTVAGMPINITVLNNVYEPVATYTPTLASVTTTGTKGIVKPLTDGSSRIGYFPAASYATLTAGQSAVDTFGYTVTDGHGATAASTVTVYVTPAGASAAAATVDFSTPVWSQSQTGFLYSLTATQPGNSLITPLQPGMLRGADSSNYNRAVSLGSAYEYVLSEGWGYPQNNWYGNGPPYLNWTAWEAYVHKVALANKGLNIHWAVWNQPEWPLYWDGTPAQLYETYLRAYNVLRQDLGPSALVGGPSNGLFAWSYIKGLADYCLVNGCEVNFLAWQELAGGPKDRMAERQHLDIAASVLMNNPAYASLNIQERVIDEMVDRPDQYNPAEILGDITALENGGADYAIKSCWNNNEGVTNCFNNSLDGLLTDAQTPRAAWWAYKYYADGVGKRVQASSPDPHLVVRASQLANGAQVLVGYYAFDANTTLPRVVTMALNNLTSAGFPAGAVVPVSIYKISATDETAMASPSLVGQTTVVSGVSTSLVLPSVALHEILVVHFGT